MSLGVWGNCGPDSNRFETTYRISEDSIFISVQDTAIDMYYCNCDYIVNIILIGLPDDKYYVNCTFPEDSVVVGRILQYKEIVIRE
ncbi:MAG: hypothetical protein IPM32_10865 [Ignavibacteriae bacterium]|nr:hypothetical protein [Ignavibacteriota bacterium]